ncbi:MAG: SDR family oxidoreductase [Dehalococcoidia bacterium]|nr:SDR family oxidoreductase [Dehalococcoidia bacterium]
MDLELAGKVALVTGGSRGIGKAVARQLALEGMDVAIGARQRAALDSAAKELTAETGRRIVPLIADTSSTEAVNAMVAATVAALGRLDVLVNNAALVGGVPSSDLATVDEAAILDDLNTKFLGYVRCARAAAPHMQRQGWGRIINIGGLAARQAGTIAGARNAAIVHLTKTLADMLGPAGITVNAIHPGTTRTERTAVGWAEQARKQGLSPEEFERKLAGQHAIRRVVDAKEIAYLVAFLVSPKAGAVTGEVIAAGGGPSRAVYY